MGIQANSGSTEERKKGSGRKKCRERKERREGLRDRGTEGQRDRGTEGQRETVIGIMGHWNRGRGLELKGERKKGREVYDSILE